MFSNEIRFTCTFRFAYRRAFFMLIRLIISLVYPPDIIIKETFEGQGDEYLHFTQSLHLISIKIFARWAPMGQRFGPRPYGLKKISARPSPAHQLSKNSAHGPGRAGLGRVGPGEGPAHPEPWSPPHCKDFFQHSRVVSVHEKLFSSSLAQFSNSSTGDQTFEGLQATPSCSPSNSASIPIVATAL